jgi:deoxyribodipyrimidine photo-lyase
VNHILHWFRRDFRVRDNAALFAAAQEAGPGGSVTGIFIIDARWWMAGEQKLGAHQAAFWLASLAELRASLESRGIQLILRTSSDPVAAILQLARQIGAGAITCNKEYEPAQIEMDDRLERAAAGEGIVVRCYKDAAIFEEQEILTGQGGVYSVFTPYKNAWLKRLAGEPPECLGLPPKTAPAKAQRSEPIPSLESLGFATPVLDFPPGERSAARMLAHFCRQALATYSQTRDFPALSLPGIDSQGVSRLSAHFNAGTLSIRQAVCAALDAAEKAKPAGRKSVETFLAELIWREFYRMILYNFPHTGSQPFNDNYRHIRWRNDPALLAAWQEGRTGYPIVDAAMMQLRQTGFMHNRLRMIAAMFLTKDLDTHWIQGERFFMRSLVDYDQASNVGGWQWSASTGTDAVPYFRVMNPVLQSERFDADGTFIRHYLPILRLVPREYIHAPWKMPAEVQRAADCIVGKDYPGPIVDHAIAKAEAIARFKAKPR